MLVRLDRVEDELLSGLSRILCYPHPEEQEVLSRISELRSLDIESLVFKGRTILFGIPVLGKGNVGVVVCCVCRGVERALKIRRVDADRGTMRHEAEMLAGANKVLVGPKLLGSTENFIIMQLVEGTSITEWIGRSDKGEDLKRLLRELLEQCRRLDEVRVDHGELSKAYRHVMVDSLNHPHIIDFETASTNRRPSNLTSTIHYLFYSKENSRRIQQVIGEIDGDTLRTKLRQYKTECNAQSFKEILMFLDL